MKTYVRKPFTYKKQSKQSGDVKNGQKLKKQRVIGGAGRNGWWKTGRYTYFELVLLKIASQKPDRL